MGLIEDNNINQGLIWATFGVPLADPTAFEQVVKWIKTQTV